MESKLQLEPLTRAHLFPLPHLILNPGGKLTLNIFEPRYLELIEDCFLNNVPMAVGHALPEEGQNFVEIPHEKFPYVFQEVGFGKVSLLAETDSKSKIVIIEGQGKGKIASVFGREGSFISVDLERCPFEAELDPQTTFLYRRLRGLTKDKVEGLVENDREVQVIMDNLNSPSQLVAFYADHLLKDFSVKLEVFSANDVNEKIRLLSNHLVKLH